MTCRSTCTLGGTGQFDAYLARALGYDHVELPVHNCVLPAGHDGHHADGDLTWTATTVTVGVRIS